jgi:hypothetical protein
MLGTMYTHPHCTMSPRAFVRESSEYLMGFSLPSLTENQVVHSTYIATEYKRNSPASKAVHYLNQ